MKNQNQRNKYNSNKINHNVKFQKKLTQIKEWKLLRILQNRQAKGKRGITRKL
jgi:hypothetical protein